MVLTDLTSPGSTGNYEACGQLPLPVIWKEINRPEIKFSREYTVHSHATTSFITQNGSKAVDLASTAVTAKWSVFYCLKNNNGDHLILRLTSLAKLKRKCVQFARKIHP